MPFAKIELRTGRVRTVQASRPSLQDHELGKFEVRAVPESVRPDDVIDPKQQAQAEQLAQEDREAFQREQEDKTKQLQAETDQRREKQRQDKQQREQAEQRA